jgi:putative ABC transport system ATP-binding protein
MLLELEGIIKSYPMGGGTVYALRSVDLGIEAGEMVAIMGSSGSGKSTLLNIIGTLDRPTAGRYVLDGQEVAALDDRALARFRNGKIGFVFQAFNLLPRYSALKNVELPMLYGGVSRGERRDRAEAALARVGLADRMHHRPSELSGGQQQRVSIARALVRDPVLLLGDEPTGALDSDTTRQVMDLFCELHASGVTVVIVTHEASVASYAQRVLRVSDGRIISDESGGLVAAVEPTRRTGMRTPPRRPAGRTVLPLD